MCMYPFLVEAIDVRINSFQSIADKKGLRNRRLTAVLRHYHKSCIKAGTPVTQTVSNQQR